jgi:hypothetical protein
LLTPTDTSSLRSLVPVTHVSDVPSAAAGAGEPPKSDPSESCTP